MYHNEWVLSRTYERTLDDFEIGFMACFCLLVLIILAQVTCGRDAQSMNDHPKGQFVLLY